MRIRNTISLYNTEPALLLKRRKEPAQFFVHQFNYFPDKGRNLTKKVEHYRSFEYYTLLIFES